MAYSSNFSLISLIFTLNILFAIAGRAVAGRDIKKSFKFVDTKKPENCVDSDGNFLIPGIGWVTVPPFNLPYSPLGASSAGNIPGGDNTIIPNPGGEAPNPGAGGYIPGGGDTFVPNPGVEVPNPAAGGVPAPP